MREFLYLGLNEDEEERRVFDGVISHIAANGRGGFNNRFAQPSSTSYWSPRWTFPFADSVQEDPVTGQRDGLLARLERRGKAPKLFRTNSAVEYWRGGGALTHIDVSGQRDLALPENVRAYMFAGTQHGGGSLPLSDVAASDGARRRYPLGSVDYVPLLRAALVNLDTWVSQGVEPPDSRIPRFADGTLVPRADTVKTFQAIPGVAFPGDLGSVLRLDFGPKSAQGIMETLPPKVVGESYPALVSAVDGDGNDLAGIRIPDVSEPLATYAAWNTRHPDIGAPRLTVPLTGATFPFPMTESERRTSGDPRPSVEAR